MTLGEKQRLFANLAARLILKAYEMGYGITLGEAWRPDFVADIYAQQGKGIVNSLHRLRLAIDLNLFRGDQWLTKTEDHRPLGTWWKQQHPLCRWGGDFQNRPDGNHYGLTHEGIQ